LLFRFQCCVTFYLPNDWTLASALRLSRIIRSLSFYLSFRRLLSHNQRLGFHHLRLSFDRFLQTLYYPVKFKVFRFILDALIFKLFSYFLESLQFSSHAFVINSKFFKKSLNMVAFGEILTFLSKLFVQIIILILQ